MKFSLNLVSKKKKKTGPKIKLENTKENPTAILRLLHSCLRSATILYKLQLP